LQSNLEPLPRLFSLPFTGRQLTMALSETLARADILVLQSALEIRSKGGFRAFLTVG
jgi:hypothetical protein